MWPVFSLLPPSVSGLFVLFLFCFCQFSVDLALDGRVIHILLTQMTIPTQTQRNWLSTQQ